VIFGSRRRPVMKRKRNPLFSLALLFVVLVLAGCTGPQKKREVVTPDRIPTRPESGKAMVVFMRPSSMGYGFQSSVFEVIKDDQPVLAGILAQKEKMVYQADPGEHLFMVIGGSADFMSADLQAGKTYYALVTPRMGAWRARFSLKPMHHDMIDSPEFNKWAKVCQWVVRTPDAELWAQANMPSIQSKQRSYYQKWMMKYESQRPRLRKEDGR
jgi:hypothetical protein